MDLETSNLIATTVIQVLSETVEPYTSREYFTPDDPYLEFIDNVSCGDLLRISTELINHNVPYKTYRSLIVNLSNNYMELHIRQDFIEDFMKGIKNYKVIL